MLGYPYCFKSCGVVLATVIMVVSLVACRLSYQLLLHCSQITNLKSYEEMAERALGKLGRQVVELCTAALNLGCVVAYINILADVLSAVAGTIIPPAAEPSRTVYIAGEHSLLWPQLWNCMIASITTPGGTCWWVFYTPGQSEERWCAARCPRLQRGCKGVSGAWALMEACTKLFEPTSQLLPCRLCMY